MTRNHGGARPNSGPKPSANKQINETVRLTPGLRESLDLFVVRNELKSRAEAVRILLAVALLSPEQVAQLDAYVKTHDLKNRANAVQFLLNLRR